MYDSTKRQTAAHHRSYCIPQTLLICPCFSPTAQLFLGLSAPGQCDVGNFKLGKHRKEKKMLPITFPLSKQLLFVLIFSLGKITQDSE